MKNLDDVDLEILRMLQKNARVTLHEIASRIGKTPSSINYRLKRIMGLGVIKKFVTVLDKEKLGFKYDAIIMIRVKPNKLDDLEKFLKNHGEVLMAYAITGIYDVCIITVFRDEDHYLKFVEELYESGCVTETTTFVIVKQIKEKYELPI